MRFKTKDLLVTVLPKAQFDGEQLKKLCFVWTRFCTYPTFHCPLLSRWEGGGCRFFLSCGGPGGSACDPTFIDCFASDYRVIEDLEDLVTLRKELTESLQRLDAVEKAGLTGAIRTKADADVLEGSLQAALEEVKNLKARQK